MHFAKRAKMSTSRILLMLLMLINYVAGELLQMTTAPIYITRVIRNITGKTVTACYMECERENGCESIAMIDEASNQLPTCNLLKKDNGHFEGGNSMTVVQTIGLGPAVNGQWGCYQNVSTCNASCGGGYLNQSRECDSPKPKHGGVNCSGLAHRTISCNTHSCQTAVDGNWGTWTNDSACTVACGGGNLTQKRLCDSPEPEHGGKDCIGERKRIISCKTHSCPVHGKWGAWKVTSFCNDGCIVGTFTKVRNCDSPAPEHGGDDCDGTRVISLPCSINKCPVVNIALNKQATQSGTFDSFKASNGNDGDRNTFSTTSYTSAPWWQVDLQADVEIEYFILRVAQGPKADVRVLGKGATDSLDHICKDTINLKPRVVTFSCDSNRRFRYVRIEQKRPGYLYINEFKVYVKKS